MSSKREMPEPNLIQKSAIYVVMTKRRSRVTKSQSPDLPQGEEGKVGRVTVKESVSISLLCIRNTISTLTLDIKRQNTLDAMPVPPCN